MNIIIDISKISPEKSINFITSSDAIESSYLNALTINASGEDHISFLNINHFIVSNSFHFTFFNKLKEFYMSRDNMLNHVDVSNLSIVNQKEFLRGLSRVYPNEYNWHI